MSMKEGAGEDPFEEDSPPETTTEADADVAEVGETTGTPAEPSPPASTSSSGSAVSIPYKFRRDGVMDGRKQIPFYLREDVIEDEDEFISQLKEFVGEGVPKADAREAAMMVAHQYPEKVAGVLRNWGFDYQD
jgi:flagellar biosynthesis/type III secretory pathway M-ring protein FliF/YscJ